MRILVSIALVLLTAGCGNPALQGLDSPSSSSVQTTNAYPAVVMVIIPSNSGMCTGTFISPRAVLTAAHCTLQAGTYTVVTSFGTYQTNNVQKFGPGTVSDTEDIAILMFDSDVADASLGRVLTLGTQVSRLDHVRLVGFGCDDIDTKLGAGVKREGTNQVASIGSYIELMTPYTAPSGAPKQQSEERILGPSNRAGSCFGDSGGPLLASADNPVNVIGVVHAGGSQGNFLVSEYTNILASPNHDFLVQMDQQYHLSIFATCPGGTPESCGHSSASVQIATFLKWIWTKAVVFAKYSWKIFF